MKRMMMVWVMILCLALFVFTSVYAETITALSSPVNPEHLENTASYARILGYDEARNTLTVELIVPEVFAEEDVLALEVPIVRTAAELTAAVRDGETALGIDNVYVVFDEDGQLATVQRFFVSWQ